VTRLASRLFVLEASVENYRGHATQVIALGTAAKRSAPMGRAQVEHIP